MEGSDVNWLPSAMEQVDEFQVIERIYSSDVRHLSVGLANISAVVPGVEENKDKILRAAKIFRNRGVNVAIFPEFCLSGYFWDSEDDCRGYMDTALTERHVDWIENNLKPLLDETLVGIVLNNLTEGPDGKYLNASFPVASGYDYLGAEHAYHKVFLPGIEKTYTQTGRDDRLVIDSEQGYGRLGFTTCYDYLFNDLLREYSLTDEVDALIQIASWRAAATRDYPGMNVRTDAYYGELWDSVLPAGSATNQVWTIACNAVGRHGVTNVPFWGGSGIWARQG